MLRTASSFSCGTLSAVMGPALTWLKDLMLNCRKLYIKYGKYSVCTYLSLAGLTFAICWV
jgi:hypothetical protein